MTQRIIVRGKEQEQSIIFRAREDGKTSLLKVPFNNYFFIHKDDYEEIEFIIRKNIKDIEEVIDRYNIKYIKLILKNNFHRNIVKNVIENAGIQTFEADIDSVKRFLILNQNIQLHQDKLKTCYFDIETDDRKPLEGKFNEDVIANSCILSFAIKDDEEKVFYSYNKARDIEGFTDDDLLRCERILLLQMFKLLKRYELVHAYNGWRFDFPFIKQRADKHGLIHLYNNLMQQHSDYMVVYKKYVSGTYKSYSLNSVCKRELLDSTEITEEQMKEVTKIDWKEITGLKKYYDLYCQYPKILKEYNIQDCNLMYILENKMNFNLLGSVTAKMCHCFYDETIFVTAGFDYAMLNEYHKRFIYAPSKPSMSEKEKRAFIKIGGGYTYCFFPGFYIIVPCYDYKSFYPTTSITFNISPDTFVFSRPVDVGEMNEIFTEKEMAFMAEVIDCKKDFLNAKQELMSGRYLAHVKKISDGMDMEKLMWRFTDKYTAREAQKLAKEKNLVFTPADMNLDVGGWNIHHHRFFRREEGVYPQICRSTIVTRDKVKYSLSEIEDRKGKESAEYRSKDLYQAGLKLMGNAGFGAFGFRSFRFFQFDVVDTITTACRWIMKKTIIFAKKHNYTALFGDTDSGYFLDRTKTFDFKGMDLKFYNYYDELIKGFNTNVEIMHTNPETGEKKIKNHFIVFEHEKTFDSVIPVVKKRYYYKQTFKDGKVYFGTQGGAWKKSDTMPLAAELQKELCHDILDRKYDRAYWVKKILQVKKDVYDDKLELDQMIMRKSVSKDISEYGQPMIDSRTGKQKLRKSDGAPMFASIPAHVLIIKYFKEIGKEIEVGDKIEYVIYDKTGKIIPLAVENYNILKKLKEQGIDITSEIKKLPYLMTEINKLNEKILEKFDYDKLYDKNYYWNRISSVLVEILVTVDKKHCFTTFANCWNLTEKQIERKIAKLEEEE